MTRTAETARTFAARSAASVTVGALAAVLGLFLPTHVLAQDQAQTQTQTQTQTLGLSGDLLQPSLQGNPATPPRFRQPGQGTNPLGNEAPPVGAFAASSMIGTMPVYGSPNGFGAGNTGFDSTNICGAIDARGRPHEARRRPTKRSRRLPRQQVCAPAYHRAAATAGDLPQAGRRTRGRNVAGAAARDAAE